MEEKHEIRPSSSSERELKPNREAFSGTLNATKRHPTTILDLFKMYLYRLAHTPMVYVIYGLVVFGAVIVVIAMAELNAQAARIATENGTTYTPYAALSEAALWCFGVPSTSLSAATVGGMTSALSTGAALYTQFGFLLLLTIAFFVGKDWKNRTFRNQILAGHGRISIYLTAQVTAILISLGGIVLWQLILWGLGSLLRIPAFLDDQFVIETVQGTASYDPAANFCLSFFMDLLIFLALTVIACAWAFIIPNSWGALGLLYATFVLFNLIATILYGVSQFNLDTYYQLQEWLFPYQFGIYSNYHGDLAAKFKHYTSNGSGYWRQVIYPGRTVALALKTTATALLGIGGMGYLGGLSFVKRDLK